MPASSGRSGASSTAGSSGASTSSASSCRCRSRRSSTPAAMPPTATTSGHRSLGTAAPGRRRGLMAWRLALASGGPGRRCCCSPAAAAAPTLGRLGENEPGQPAPSLPPVPYEVTFAGDLPPELATLLRQVAAELAPRVRHRRPAGSPSASAREADRSQAWSRRCARRAISTGRSSFAIVDVAEARARRASLSEVERLATPPEAVLRVRRRARPALPASARSRWSSRTIRDGYKPPEPKALGLVAGEPALTQAVLDAEQKLLDRRPQGRLRAGEARRARGRRRSRRPRDGRHLAARAGPAGRLRRGELHRRRRVSTDFLRAPRPVRGRRTLTIPTLVDGGPEQSVRHRPVLDHRAPAGGRADAGRAARRRLRSASQRPPRTIGAELNYETDLGPGGQAVLGASQHLRRGRAVPHRGLRLARTSRR